MSDQWIGAGLWAGWRMTTEHAASNYGQPVLVDPEGKAYGPGDIKRPERAYTQADLARALNVTPGAIVDRMRRGTLPPKDDPRGWKYETIKYLLEERP